MKEYDMCAVEKTFHQ